ncbi:MAG: CinA family protein [Dehalococcoidales bacterium]|nr:CinA family protein [Dehalococcoidales bacterium]
MELILAGLAQEVGDLLRCGGLTLGVVESASGGLLSHLITGVPGCSDYYKGAIISYSNEVKIGLVGVKGDTIAGYGVVSGHVAREMARGGRVVLSVDICLADTGIAGPGGAVPGKPVGLFYIGLADEAGAYSRKCNFSGGREQNKLEAAGAALQWLKEYLLDRKGT